MFLFPSIIFFLFFKKKTYWELFWSLISPYFWIFFGELPFYTSKSVELSITFHQTKKNKKKQKKTKKEKKRKEKKRKEKKRKEKLPFSFSFLLLFLFLLFFKFPIQMPFTCDVCLREFKSNQGLGSHLRKHKNELELFGAYGNPNPDANPDCNSSNVLIPEVLDLDSDEEQDDLESSRRLSSEGGRQIFSKKNPREEEKKKNLKIANPIALPNLDDGDVLSTQEAFGPYKNKSCLKFAQMTRRLKLKQFQVQGLLDFLEDDEFSFSEVRGLTAKSLENIEQNVSNREVLISLNFSGFS